MTKLGEYIRKRRRALDMTQKGFSARLKSMGVNRSQFAVSNWETGRQTVPLDLLPPIAAALEEKSLANLYDLAGVVDAFSSADLIRLLNGATASDVEYITEMAKTYLKHKSNE